MLSELARYITHKEQPISMGGCTSFARLCIRGLAQPFFKRVHNRKMVGEIKNQFNLKKMSYKLYLRYKTIRSQLHPIYGLPVNMDSGTLVLPGIGSMISGYYKKGY
jgi:hypothetical protein